MFPREHRAGRVAPDLGKPALCTRVDTGSTDESFTNFYSRVKPSPVVWPSLTETRQTGTLGSVTEVRPAHRERLHFPQLISEGELSVVYLALLNDPVADRDSLIASGLDAELVDGAVLILRSRGMVVVGDDGSWDVPEPDIAVPAWAADTERRARGWRANASSMHQMYSAARATPVPDSGSRELHTLADIASATSTITAAASREILCIRADSRRTQQMLLDPFNSHREFFRNAHGEVVRIRAIYDPSILDLDGTLEALRERVIGGEEVRFTGPIHFSAVIVDDTAAVVEFSNIDASGAGAMVLRSKPFVAALVRLAETLWSAGMPLLAEEDSPQPETIASRDAIIVGLLAGGGTDSTITRRLNISQRTVERRIRHIMDSLGATTRFQAGVEAVRQGLV